MGRRSRAGGAALAVAVALLAAARSGRAQLATTFNAWLNDLAVYGPMRLADRQRPHWPAYGLSWTIGADIAVTTSILRSTFDEEPAAPDSASLELARAGWLVRVRELEVRAFARSGSRSRSIDTWWGWMRACRW